MLQTIIFKRRTEPNFSLNLQTRTGLNLDTFNQTQTELNT